MNKFYAIKLVLSVFIASLIAVTNSYIVNLKGAEVDAERFLEHANDWSLFGEFKFAIDAEFYIQFIGVFVHLFDFGEFQLTLIGLLFYYLIFYKFFIISDAKKLKKIWAFHVVTILALFSPSVLLRIGALLREPYFMFALAFMVYYGYKYLDTYKIKYVFFSIGFGVFGMFFHKALLAFMPMYFMLLLFFSTKLNVKSLLFGFVIAGFSVVVIVAVFPHLTSLRGGTALEVVLSGEFSGAERVVGYKSGREFRTTYDYGADFSNILMVFVTVLKANYYYYFSPFIWKIGNAADVFAFIENSLRIYIIIYIVSFLRKSRDKKILFILICYLLFNTIWAIGTSNYGTGSRHHITTIPLLMLALIFLSKRKYY